MANQLQLVDLGGQQVWVEVTDILPGADQPPHSPGHPHLDDRFQATSQPKAGPLDQASAQLTKVDVAPIIQAVFGPVRQALEALAPQEVKVELSLGLKAGVGLFIASGEGSASLKVSAKWKPQGGKPRDAGA